MMTRLRILIALLAASLALVACSSAPPSRGAQPVEPSTSAAPAEPSPTPSPTPSPPPVPTEPLNVLLVGTDTRDPGSFAGRSDTMMMVHVPADRSAVYLISFTRDMWVAVPGHGEGKLNVAYAVGGVPLLEQTISELLGGGVSFQHTVVTNFGGFVALTDALGGIEVENRHPSTVGEWEFPAGRITISGEQALAFVRDRQTMPLGDLDRTERQRAAMVGIFERLREQAADPAALAGMVQTLQGYVQVTGDVDPAEVLAMAPLVQALGPEDAVSLMVPITGFAMISGQSANVVDAEQTAALGEALRTDTMSAYVEAYGTEYAP